MAHAEVEERQLLKAMTWWDGFVVALANPGFLIAGLGGSIGALASSFTANSATKGTALASVRGP